MIRVLDLFSGIGGFSLGLERTGGFKTVAFCEIEPFASRVLAKHWPEVPCYDDVRTLTADRLAADGIGVDAICGGFPCQDISVANTDGEGLDGERSGLWSEYHRIIRELRPSIVIVENVTNLLSGPSERPGEWFGRVLGSLAEIGYDAEWHCLRAARVGLPHHRDRIWIVAYPSGKGWQGSIKIGRSLVRQIAAFTKHSHAASIAWSALDDGSGRLRVGDGVPLKMERNRLHACGNAVVPQIPELIGRAILAAERTQ